MSNDDGRDAEVAAPPALEPEFGAFGADDAWELGCLLRTRAAAAGHAVTIDIRRPTGILFHSALPGALPDQQEWVRKKAQVVFRFEASSALIAQRLAGASIDAAALGWLDPAEYALAGGSVPVRVTGAGVVAAVTVSGLSSDEDHQLVIDGMLTLLADL